jgi:hypothetical protein
MNPPKIRMRRKLIRMTTMQRQRKARRSQGGGAPHRSRTARRTSLFSPTGATSAPRAPPPPHEEIPMCVSFAASDQPLDSLGTAMFQGSGFRWRWVAGTTRIPRWWRECRVGLSCYRRRSRPTAGFGELGWRGGRALAQRASLCEAATSPMTCSPPLYRI